MSSDYLVLNIPDHQQSAPAPQRHSVSRHPPDTSEQTILEQVAQVLSTHPRIRVCLCTGGSIRSSMPTGSPLTEEVLRFAAHKAGYLYGHQPPLGPRFCAPRIQRLVLGVAELLQAELLEDPGCDLDQLGDELQTVSKCLSAGFQHLANHDAQDASDGDDTECDDDIDGETDDDQ